jgi:integrase
VLWLPRKELILYMAKKRANGEGNIRKRKDGRWEGRYTVGHDPETGKAIIKNVLGKTQAECKAKLSAALESVKGIDVSRADEYTVATWLRSWYDIYAKPNVRVATAGRYQLMVEQYTIPRIGNIKLTKLTAHDLQKLYKELMENGRIDRKSGHGNPGLSSTTVRSLHLMLHNAFERAIKERLIPRNPTEDCIAPKVQKIEMQILPPEHIKDYLEAADRRGLLPMFYLELVSGLRKGELVALQWSDLDEANCTISVSKQASWDTEGNLILSQPKTGNSIREASIPQDAVELLKQEHAKHPDNPWMFPSGRTGEMYQPDSVVTLHKRILKDAGLEHIRFHDLRHTFATLALQNGVDVKTVSSMLGHYDAGFTLRTYTHVTRQMQQKAAEKMGSFMAQVM